MHVVRRDVIINDIVRIQLSKLVFDLHVSFLKIGMYPPPPPTPHTLSWLSSTFLPHPPTKLVLPLTLKRSFMLPVIMYS